ncbi:MAG: NAD(P)-binding domain-containing protein, partial [Rikenellaceae bacterium]
MKIGIIGAGNMGGAIARGLIASGTIAAQDIYISCPNRHFELDALRAFAPTINTSTSNEIAVVGTDLIIIATKPWLVDSVMQPLVAMIDPRRQIIASVAAGVTLDYLSSLTGGGESSAAVFRIMPNTAIMVGQSMTFVSSANASSEQNSVVISLFEAL